MHDNALEYGISLTQHELDLFGIYLAELNFWNIKINLTGLSSNERIINELFLDSIIPALYLPLRLKMLDIGSGAGFPAIPLKIIRPRFNVLLLESNSKRVNFLKHIIRILELKDIRLYKGRAENSLERLSKEGFDLITARALAPLEQTIALCSPFLLQNRYLISFLGKDAEKILETNKAFLEKNLISIHKKISYTLPGKITRRHYVIFKKYANNVLKHD